MFQGWVSILSCLLVVVSPWNGERRRGGGSGGVAAEPQLWGPEPWEPERRAKSLGFLGKEEAAIRDIDSNSVAGGAGEDEDKDEDAGAKKAILNVSDKDSPYALIDKYFPERESYFYQNRNKFLSEFRDSGRGGGGADIGDLDPSEVSGMMGLHTNIEPRAS